MTNFVLLAIQTFYVTNYTPKSVEYPYCQLCESVIQHEGLHMNVWHPHIRHAIKTNYTILITTNINITYFQNGITNFTIIKQ